MSGSSAEHDFFGVDDSSAAAAVKKPTLEKKKSFREISRMSPEVIKTVMATAAAAGAGSKQQSTSSSPPPPPLPVLLVDNSAPSGSKEAAPLTIFYNGAVAVFDLPQEKAENILKLVEEKDDDDHLNRGR